MLTTADTPCRLNNYRWEVKVIYICAYKYKMSQNIENFDLYDLYLKCCIYIIFRLHKRSLIDVAYILKHLTTLREI